MKKLLLVLLLTTFFATSFGQSVDDILPVSWELTETSELTPIVLSPLDLAEIHRQDSINDLDKSRPWRYGITRSVNIDINEEGRWTTLDDGDRIWQVGIQSPNAQNMSLILSNFYIPEGGLLHFYNDDRSEVSVTYTSKNNRANEQLASWFVNGEIIWIEYYEPATITDTVKLEISEIIHGYRMGKLELFDEAERGLNDSGDCNYDVNCAIGDDFDDKKNILKKSVAMLTLGNGFLCSASLINNIEGDRTPYLLTANHCLVNSDPSFWTVRFNWMSPNPVCGTGEESADLETNFTMSGATLRANNSISDFALVELYNRVPESWDIAFAGWDRSDIDPQFEVGIHHPNGDIMKICRDDTGAVKENANGTEVWLIGGVSVGSGNGWEIGTTESGSSGSPLFDQHGRIIGQLYAGQSFCDGLQTNNDYDIYGRFGISWDYGDTPGSRLRDWLDPLDTGQTTTETMQNILNIPEIELIGKLDIYPNPVSSNLMVMNSRYPNLTYRFFNILGQEMMSGSMSNTINSLSVVNLSDGVYFLHLIDGDSGATITKKILVNR